MTRSAQDNTKALDAFLAAKFEIDAMLERLAALSADHFEVHARLREITDMAFREGEHAE